MADVVSLQFLDECFPSISIEALRNNPNASNFITGLQERDDKYPIAVLFLNQH